jgi:hypothetical protein
MLIDAEINKIEQALTVISTYATDKSCLEIAFEIDAMASGKPSKQQQIMEGVVEILSDGKQIHTADILKQLSALGIAVGGDKPEANLSAYLSRAKDSYGLVNDRRYGWSLKKENPEDAPTSSGSVADDKSSHLF